MDVLPPLFAGHAGSLPLAGPTADGLAAALLAADDAMARRAQLRHLLAQDPALALWTICRAALAGQRSLATCDALADWLAANLSSVLDWRQAEEVGTSAPADIPAPRAGPALRSLATRSFAVSALAALVAESSGVDREAALLLGLVHNASGWMAASDCETPPILHDVAQSLLPGDRPKSGTPAGCVAEAIRITAAAATKSRRARGNSTGLAFKFDRRRHQREVAALVDRWCGPSVSAGWLPALAARLRKLAALEADFARRLETEKLDSLKELAYGAGHEINNPLANISARAQTLLTQERDPERRRLLAAINAQAFRAHEMIADMMLFARPPEPEFATVDLARLLTSIARELAAPAREQETQLVCRTPEVLHARIDATQVRVAVRALCFNALEALGKGGRIEVIAAPSEVAQAHETRSGSPSAENRPANSSAAMETVQITVADNGPGISPDVRKHIFDPFYSGRDAGRGLGFGLSKCWRIVQMHGGQIEVESAPGEGALFTLRLPARTGF